MSARRCLRSPAAAVIVLAGLLGIPGCENGSTSTTALVAAATYRGAFTGASLSGRVTLSTAPYQQTGSGSMTGTTVTTTGVLTLSGGQTVAVSGTFDVASGQVSVTGGGYALVGTISSQGDITGTWTGPGGTGGAFAATPDTGNITVFCGSFAGPDSGRWTIVVSSTGPALAIFASATGANTGVLTGTATAGSVTFTQLTGGSFSATGTITGDAVTGTWNDGTGRTGTWSGSSTGC